MNRKPCLINSHNNYLGNINLCGYYKTSDNSIISIRYTEFPEQERYESFLYSYIKRYDYIFLLYDISNKSSFNRCKHYSEYIKTFYEGKVMLIGNKKDLECSRQISFEEANNFALSNNYIYMETSCKNNENVYESFEKVVEITLNERKKREKKRENEISNKKKNIKFDKKKNECIII